MREELVNDLVKAIKTCRVARLSSAAAPILQKIIGRPRQSRGVAVVVRRREVDDLCAQGVIEVAFTREYW